jgi:penicillin V acylase-like amidase (Ntn superfamily)
MKKKFLGVGWKSKIIQKRATAYISINKIVVDGCCLEKGQLLYSYLAEDEKGRKIIITYLDGKRQIQTNLKFR